MFLNTLLLYGTALGSVPILIHLLNKRRFTPIQWAAMEFLLQAIQKNARRLQLRDIIMMLLRTLAVVFLALALARPAVSARGIPGGGSKTAAIILLDNSLSMGYTNGQETRFELARKLAKNVLNQLDSGSWCALFTFNDDVRAPLGDPSNNMAYLEQELQQTVQISDGGTNLEKALQRAQKVFDTHPEYISSRRELYIITDMQSRAWNPKDVSGDFKAQLKRLCDSSSIYLINAGDGGGENAAVVDLTPEDTLVATDMPARFVAKIKNFGQSDMSAVPVDFYVDPSGKDDRPADRQTVTLGAGEVTTVHFETKFQSGGDHKIEVRLADDRLMADNRRYCSIEVVQEAQVLLVDGKDQRADDPLSNETGYLRYVLSPKDPENPEKQSVISTEAVPHYRLNEKNLLNYQAMVISNVARLPKASIQRIDKQVRAGMGLMIFLGDQVDLDDYNSNFGDAGTKLLPALIKPAWGEAPAVGEAKLPPSVAFSTEKLSHPVMTEFNNPDFGSQFLNDIKIYKAYDLDVAKDEGVRVVAYLANGKPAIIEKKVGQGIVFLFAFPATTAWTNLPTQPAFAIIMLRAANMLTLGNRLPKNLPVTATIHGAVPLADPNATVKIIPPPPGQHRETRPEMTPDGRAVFDFHDTDKAGFYDVVLDRVPKVTLTYALNANTELESNLSFVTPETLHQDYPDFQFTFISRAEDFQKKMQSERHGTELWPWLMFLVFAMLATESVLANRWAPKS
jgi:hypothetical protein